MASQKSYDSLVDGIAHTLDLQVNNNPRSCFIVFSSHEPHIEVPIFCVEYVLPEFGNFEIKRLDTSLLSGDGQYDELLKQIKSCSLAIVILDGLRPNVVFEYGIILGLSKPCIVLKDGFSKVDVMNYFSSEELKQLSVTNPPLNVKSHFSDVCDRYYVSYDAYKPKDIIQKLRTQIAAKKQEIDLESRKILFPHWNIIESELTTLIGIASKNEDELLDEDETEFRHIVKIINEKIRDSKIEVTSEYYLMIARMHSNFQAYDEAITVLNDYLQTQPILDIDVVLLKSRIQILARSPEDAIATIDEALVTKKDDPVLMYEKANVYELIDRSKEAKTYYKKSKELGNKSPELFLRYGIVSYREKCFDEALEQFDLILQADPTNEGGLYWKTRTLQAMGKTDEARELSKQASQCCSENPTMWLLRSELASTKEEELQYLEQALAINIDFYPATSRKLSCLHELKRFDEAIILVDTLIKKYSKDRSFINHMKVSKALLLREMGRYQEAYDILEPIPRTLKKDSSVLGIKAELLARMTKYDSALELFGLSLALNPKNSNALYNKSCTFALMGNAEEAISTLKETKKIDNTIVTKEKVEADADFDRIRNSPEYQKFLSEEL